SFWSYKCLYSKGFRSFTRIGGYRNGLSYLILTCTVKFNQHFACLSRCYRCIFWILGYGTTATAGGIGYNQRGITSIGERKNSFLGRILLYGTKIVLNFIEFHNRNAFGGRIPFGGNCYIGGIDLAGRVFLTGKQHKYRNKA